MSDRASQTWNDYRPSKGVWFWSVAGAVALTMIIGFTWGGWVTGGTAREMAETAGEDSAAKLAAAICAHRFLQAPDAGPDLAALKEADSWDRDDLVEDGGWVTFAGGKFPVEGAADRCADVLAEADLPVAASGAEEIRTITTTN